MSKQVLTVADALAKIKASSNSTRFNKEKLNDLLHALVNDVDYTAKVVAVQKEEISEIKDVMVTKGFRKFLKKVIEKAGVDNSESEKILTSDFTIDNVDGLYEFISEAVYLFMETGRKFDFLPKEDFKGSLQLKDVEESETEADKYHPSTREHLGKFRTKKSKHKKITASSNCPAWMKVRTKVD